jgi:1-deoxy-D-xylulose-5-phosphate synthase
MRAAVKLEKAGVHAAVVNARFVNPVDRDLILSIASRVPRIVTIEENVLKGGFGSSVIECLNDAEVGQVHVKRLGIPDRFIEQGTPERLRARYGIDEDGIFLAALSFLREHSFSS